MGFETGSTITTDSGTRTRTNEELSNLGREDDVYSTANHAQSIRKDSTDEVDVRKLVAAPSISDIRWLYRFFFAQTIVDKPVDDAFKHGYEVQYDPTNSVKSALDDTNYIEQFKMADKKARRDGFSLLFRVTNDGTDSLSEELTRDDFNSLEALKPLTIDDLDDAKPSGFRSQLPTQYQPDEGQTIEDTVEVRDSGMVVSRVTDDPEFGNPIGYLLNRRQDNRGDPEFVHESRVQHIAWNKTADGDYNNPSEMNPFVTDEWGSLGEWEGDSILLPAYHILKSLFKGDWATMETLFRYSSPLYEVSLPERADKDALEKARNNFRNLNAKSDAVMPHGYEIEMHDTDGQLTPTEYFEPMFEQICASVEMTKSVLFGTQQGTVSGSETDVQNYFNQVERYQNGHASEKIRKHLEWLFRMDQSQVPSMALGYEIKWPQLFELSELDKADLLSRVSQSLKLGFEHYFISPEEGRDIFAEVIGDQFDVEIDGELDEEDYETMRTLQVAQQGAPQTAQSEGSQGSGGSESARSSNNGGGQTYGNTTSSEQPNTNG